MSDLRRTAILRAAAAEAGRIAPALPPRLGPVVVYRQGEVTPEQLVATRAAVVAWLRRLRTKPVR